LFALIRSFSSLHEFSAKEVEQVFATTLAENHVSAKDFIQLFRVCLTGISGGPPVFEMCELFGKENTILRLENALGRLKT
jgi:glutamyl-tRNA synthetase